MSRDAAAKRHLDARSALREWFREHGFGTRPAPAGPCEHDWRPSGQTGLFRAEPPSCDGWVWLFYCAKCHRRAEIRQDGEGNRTELTLTGAGE